MFASPSLHVAWSLKLVPDTFPSTVLSCPRWAPDSQFGLVTSGHLIIWGFLVCSMRVCTFARGLISLSARVVQSIWHSGYSMIRTVLLERGIARPPLIFPCKGLCRHTSWSAE